MEIARIVAVISVLTTGFSAAATEIAGAMATMPIMFERNVGQVAGDVAYQSRGQTYAYGFRESSIVIAVPQDAESPTRFVTLTFDGASTEAELVPQDPAPTQIAYFVGHDASQWRHKVPAFNELHALSLYPGIDLRYYGNGGMLEFDVVVAPGADLDVVAIDLDGVDTVEQLATGALRLHVGSQTISLKAPITYQQEHGIAEAQPVDSRYIVDGMTLRFGVSGYDPALPLVVDPVILVSTYLGGPDGFDAITDVYYAERDENHQPAIYACGSTFSTGFPTSGHLYDFLQDNPIRPEESRDAFVVKFSTDLKQLLFATYLGGSLVDEAYGIAVSEGGIIHVCGGTESYPAEGRVGFPLNVPYQESFANVNTEEDFFRGMDAFYTEIYFADPAGPDLLFSTYLGGADHDYFSDISFSRNPDTQDFNYYLVGATDSKNTPDIFGPGKPDGAIDPVNAVQRQHGGQTDVLLASFKDGLFNMVSFFGGIRDDVGTCINAEYLNGEASFVFGGYTGSGDDFQLTLDAPITQLEPITTSVYRDGGFVTAMKANGGVPDVLYSTFYSGSGIDMVTDVSAYANLFTGLHYCIVGTTTSTDLPSVNAFQPTHADEDGDNDGFIAVLRPGFGEAIRYASYLGGEGDDEIYGLAHRYPGITGPRGEFIVGGDTMSDLFPIKNSLSKDLKARPSGASAFVSMFNVEEAGESSLEFSSYIGGTGSNRTSSINRVAVQTGFSSSTPPDEALDLVVLGGSTTTRDYPGTAGAFQENISEGDESFARDAVLSVISIDSMLDIDGDGIPDSTDNCPNTHNPTQTNSDTDSHGDACDNCPEVANEGQENRDGDFWGDACDPCPDSSVPSPPLFCEEPEPEPSGCQRGVPFFRDKGAGGNLGDLLSMAIMALSIICLRTWRQP